MYVLCAYSPIFLIEGSGSDALCFKKVNVLVLRFVPVVCTELRKKAQNVASISDLVVEDSRNEEFLYIKRKKHEY
jgi:hypothetical protein